MLSNDESLHELISKIKFAIRETDQLVKDLEHKLRNKEHIRKMSQQLQYHKHQKTFMYQDLNKLDFDDGFKAANANSTSNTLSKHKTTSQEHKNKKH